ncbi:hypothetical protein [Maritimibacter sp. DP1N21-5]|uniref:hypothetical protein n=1 Tax=Maritimibacter sp. DP1N21-5 TaxID=2836867 RepID=UPI001C49602B|nr:hypothetical protein [Maritimibacter sp. DP1N21-5]MBV7409629.1 hypothetical protein [Maritimibacter sp. DP1N21-5]
MSYIETKRNQVHVGRPLATDTVVATFLHGSTGPRRLLCVQPLANYQRAVNWALSMADYMAGPIELLPYESEEALQHALFMSEVHHLTFASDDPEVRLEARELFLSLADWPTIRERRKQ